MRGFKGALLCRMNCNVFLCTLIRLYGSAWKEWTKCSFTVDACFAVNESPWWAKTGAEDC